MNEPRQISAVVTHPDSSEEESWDDPVRGKVRWWTLLSADRTPSEALTCGVAEVESGDGSSLRLHRHAQPEIYHVLSGTGIVTIDDAEHLVRQGSTLFIPGNALHGSRSIGTEPLRLFYVFPTDSFADVVYDFPPPDPIR